MNISIINMENKITPVSGNIKITLGFKCYDKDGKLKWVDNIDLTENKNNTGE